MRLPGQFGKDIEQARAIADEDYKRRLARRGRSSDSDTLPRLEILQMALDLDDQSEEMDLDAVENIKILAYDSGFTIEKIMILHGSDMPKDLYDALESGEFSELGQTPEILEMARYYDKNIKEAFEKEKHFSKEAGLDTNIPSEFEYTIGGNGFFQYIESVGIRKMTAELGYNGFVIKARVGHPYDDVNDCKVNSFGWFYSPDFGMNILNKIAKWALATRAGHTSPKKKSKSLSKF
jgi:hypothetical protein